MQLTVDRCLMHWDLSETPHNLHSMNFQPSLMWKPSQGLPHMCLPVGQLNSSGLRQAGPAPCFIRWVISKQSFNSRAFGWVEHFLFLPGLLLTVDQDLFVGTLGFDSGPSDYWKSYFPDKPKGFPQDIGLQGSIIYLPNQCEHLCRCQGIN